MEAPEQEIGDPFRGLPWDLKLGLWAKIGYAPQPYQERMHRVTDCSGKAVAGGTGAAKTMTCAMDLAPCVYSALYRAKMGQGFYAFDGYFGRVGLVGPNYDKPRTLFRYLHRTWAASGLVREETVTTPRQGQWRMVSTTGVEVKTISAGNPEDFAAEPYSEILVTEAMKCPFGIISAAKQRLQRWPGPYKGMLWIEGTFEDRGEAWYPELCTDWNIPLNSERGVFFSFPSWDNTYSTPDGFNDESIQHLLTFYRARDNEDEFWVKIGGRIPKIKGRLWSRYLRPDEHIGRDDNDPAYIPELPVDWTFDPARHRYGGLFIQRPAWNRIHVLDEIVHKQASFEKFRLEWLNHPWVRNNPRRNVGRVVSDVAAVAHHQGLDSTYERWQAPIANGGCGVIVEHKYMLTETGLDVLITAFDGTQFSIKINPKCKELIYDLTHETDDGFGKLDAKKNKGKDDLRKSLSYYIGVVVGTGVTPRERQESYDAFGQDGDLFHPNNLDQQPRGLFG